MTTRTRWISLALGLAVVVGLVTLYLFNSNLTLSSIFDRGPKTWMVAPGESRTWNADEVEPDDGFQCSGSGTFIDHTPGPGTDLSRGGMSIAVAEDGTVTITCAAMDASEI